LLFTYRCIFGLFCIIILFLQWKCLLLLSYLAKFKASERTGLHKLLLIRLLLLFLILALIIHKILDKLHHLD